MHNHISYSDNMLKLLELDESFRTFDVNRFFEFVHPDDLQMILQATRKAQEKQRPQPAMEYRLVTSTKQVIWGCMEPIGKDMR